jgi:phospholipase C
MLSGTASNRLYLMSGCIQNPNNPTPPSILGSGPSGAALNNPPLKGNSSLYTLSNGCPFLLSWQSYADMLTIAKKPVPWKVYEETGDTPTWSAAASPTNGWGSLNVLDLFGSDHSSGNVSTGYGQFETDAANGLLPTVSWLILPFGLTEWERNHSGDGAYNIALKLNAILNHNDADGVPSWNSTVFILTYDENDGHFDHLAPPTPRQTEYPQEWKDEGDDLGPQPIGLGFRVPAIIISPWTFGRRVEKQVFDHTSILQFWKRSPMRMEIC